MTGHERRLAPIAHGALRPWVAAVGVFLLMAVSTAAAMRSVETQSVAMAQQQAGPPGNMKHLDFEELGGAGTDHEFFVRDGRTYVAAAAIGRGFHIFDITGPLAADPKLISRYPSPGYQNDIQVQGNLAVLGTDEGGNRLDPNDPCGPVPSPVCNITFEGIELVDITNLAAPVPFSKIAISGGAHNSTLVGNYIYVSNPSRRALDIVDATDPRKPKVVKRIAEPSRCANAQPYPCEAIQNPASGELETDWYLHDITYDRNAAGQPRLYVAALESTWIMDATDPVNLKPIVKIPNRDPLSDAPEKDPLADYRNIQLSHQSDLSPDKRLLLVTDERGGGIEETVCPGGGVHVFDVSDETNPRKVGVYFVPDQRDGNCTSHVFRFLPDRNVMVIGWYSAGTWVVDMGSATPPDAMELKAPKGRTTTWGRTLGHIVMQGADTWASKSPGLTADGKFYVYATDLGRGGMDVFEFTAVDQLPPPMAQPGVTATPVGPTSTALPTATQGPPTSTATQGPPTSTATQGPPTSTAETSTTPTTGAPDQRKLYLPFVLK